MHWERTTQSTEKIWQARCKLIFRTHILRFVCNVFNLLNRFQMTCIWLDLVYAPKVLLRAVVSSPDPVYGMCVRVILIRQAAVRTCSFISLACRCMQICSRNEYNRTTSTNLSIYRQWIDPLILRSSWKLKIRIIRISYMSQFKQPRKWWPLETKFILFVFLSVL